MVRSGNDESVNATSKTVKNSGCRATISHSYRRFSQVFHGYLSGTTLAQPVTCLKLVSFRIRVMACLLLWAGGAEAATVSLAWDRNPDVTTVGYLIEYGNQPGKRPFTVDVGNRTTWDLTGLVDGTPYYFAVRAYNTLRQFSGPSTEIAKRVGVPSSTRNDFDGDARADLVVYRPNSGGWFFRYSTLNYSSNSPGYLQWGLPTDKPLAKRSSTGTETMPVSSGHPAANGSSACRPRATGAGSITNGACQPTFRWLATSMATARLI